MHAAVALPIRQHKCALPNAIADAPRSVDHGVAEGYVAGVPPSSRRVSSAMPQHRGSPLLRRAHVVSRPEWMETATLEVREHEGSIWRVPFSDSDATTLYVSAQDGRILERRNDSWRLFDFVWMLHIMDYTGRKDFNNPLVITAASGGLWNVLSGIWLLVTSFRLSEFVPARRRQK